MTAQELITDSVPSVKPSDNAARVLDWMGEFKVGQLAVVDKGALVGIVSEEDLLELEDPGTKMSKISFALGNNIFVFEDDHFFEVLRRANIHNLDMLPVVARADHAYVGAVTRKDIVNQAAMVLSVGEPGGIIVIEVAFNSYALSEISRICESDNAKVLSLAVTNSPNPQKLYVTLKLNIRELSRLLASFERFGYDVVHTVTDTEQLDDSRDRYDNFMRYLNT
jgi:acetoin utilization protein AcuB